MNRFYFIRLPDQTVASADVQPWRGGYMISRLHVPPHQRGRGHGKELLEALILVADDEQVSLTLEIHASGPMDNEALQRWYERHGFERDHAEPFWAMRRRPVAKTGRQP